MNEPAFPAEEWIDSTDPHVVNPKRHLGMTLRDYFAAKAMQGAIVNATLGGMPGVDDGATEAAGALARACYAVADAMLKAREA
jgi:hypothetical protein